MNQILQMWIIHGIFETIWSAQTGSDPSYI